MHEDSDTTPEAEAIPLSSTNEVEPGDVVVVLKKGMFYGQEGTVLRKSRSQLDVDLGGVSSIKLKKEECGRLPEGVAPGNGRKPPKVSSLRMKKTPGVSKRTASLLEDPRSEGSRSKKARNKVPKWESTGESEGAVGSSAVGRDKKGTPSVRVAANTCDLRGFRYDEAIPEVERFLSNAAVEGRPIVFLLHGHGTGALKRGLREEFLPTAPGVKRWDR